MHVSILATLGGSLPLVVLVLGEGSLLVCTEQVSVVIVPPGVSGTDLGDLPLTPSKGQVVSVVLALQVPSVGHHEVKVGVVVDVG